MLPVAQARSWVLPAVQARLQPGQSDFLAELRPAVALFVRFPTLDYDGDAAAGARLDVYVRWVQQVLGRYEGVLVDLTMGGRNYLYAAFGAPLAHAAAASCAAAAALELCAPAPSGAGMTPVQIGLSQGMVWAGACGGPTRRTYAVLGDSVNLGARLMQHAAPGEILAAEAVCQATRKTFRWTERPPVQVKGKAEPVTGYALAGAHPQWDLGLLEPTYDGPLLDREADLAWLHARLAEAAAGHGQSVGVAGEAGMGKSRLVVEVMRRARAAGWAVYGGAAQAYGTETPYLAWQALWRSFFALDPRLSPAAQARQVAAARAANQREQAQAGIMLRAWL
jgi:class 3 adenylate cyclase